MDVELNSDECGCDGLEIATQIDYIERFLTNYRQEGGHAVRRRAAPCGSVRCPCGAARTHQITWTDAARIRTDNTFNFRAAN